ncbi:MAG: hypothetical protein GF416_00320 [Candidatus Altiarchaeales archaeon]|nr:hypothetical protein [Candidatus Altiarchaeales archaeon]MBD3415564.1 hypothetical protein [Candidatus Altiarchaeales archaeon]
MKVLLLGTRELGFIGLERIFNSGRHEVVGVVTKEYEITEGYGEGEYREFCKERNIPVFITDNVNNEEFAEKVKRLKPDVGVSLYWRRIVKQPLIGVPEHGFINVHSSDLPRYRGFAATSWSIINGDSEIGACVHMMVDGKADEGDILAKRHIPITEETTIRTLQEKLWPMEADMVLEVLDMMGEGRVEPEPQDESKLVMAYPRLPSDGLIDWKDSAVRIDRLVRAITKPYPGAHTYYREGEEIKKLTVWESSVLEEPPEFMGTPGHIVKIDKEGGGAWVLTGDGILVLKLVEVEGEGEFQPARRWRSIQKRLGLNVEEEIYRLSRRG